MSYYNIVVYVTLVSHAYLSEVRLSYRLYKHFTNNVYNIIKMYTYNVGYSNSGMSSWCEGFGILDIELDVTTL